MRTWSLFFLLFSFLLTSCASLPTLKNPDINLVSIEPAKRQGFAQYFTLNLLVTNPNSFDLTIDGVTFNLSVADQNIMSGVTNTLPILKAYSETPVKLSANVGLFDLLKLLTSFGQNPTKEMTYHLKTVIDPSGFIPLTINRKGILDDKLLSGLKKGK